MRVLIRSPLHILHTPISLKDPEAKYSPFGENTTLKTLELPVRVLIRSPLDTLHTPIVSDPDAKYSLFGENATLWTSHPWP